MKNKETEKEVEKEKKTEKEAHSREKMRSENHERTVCGEGVRNKERNERPHTNEKRDLKLGKRCKSRKTQCCDVVILGIRNGK